jgi:DNA-binding Lrp family transcriptional regulator
MSVKVTLPNVRQHQDSTRSDRNGMTASAMNLAYGSGSEDEDNRSRSPQDGSVDMDQLTKRVIQILRRDGRSTVSDIARELGITRQQAASRVNPLLQSGQLRVIAAPHPRVLGNHVNAHIFIKVRGSLQSVIEVLQGIDSLGFISVVAGAFQVIAEIGLPSMMELRRQISMIRAIAGVADVQLLLYERLLGGFFVDEEPESFNSNFDEHDIRIIGALQHDGRASYAQLARRVGLSLSGCRVRVQRLLESGVMQIGAINQRFDMTDDLLFSIGICAEGELRDITQLLRAESGLEFMARTVGCYDIIATVSFNSLRNFNKLMEQLLKLPTVACSEQWLHVRLVRGRYDRSWERLRVVEEATAATVPQIQAETQQLR